MTVDSLLSQIRELRKIIDALKNIQELARSFSSSLSSASNSLKSVIINGEAFDKGELVKIIRDLSSLINVCTSAINKINGEISELQEQIKILKEEEREKAESILDSNNNVDFTY